MPTSCSPLNSPQFPKGRVIQLRSLHIPRSSLSENGREQGKGGDNKKIACDKGRFTIPPMVLKETEGRAVKGSDQEPGPIYEKQSTRSSNISYHRVSCILLAVNSFNVWLSKFVLTYSHSHRRFLFLLSFASIHSQSEFEMLLLDYKECSIENLTSRLLSYLFIFMIFHTPSRWFVHFLAIYYFSNSNCLIMPYFRNGHNRHRGRHEHPAARHLLLDDEHRVSI